MPLPLSLVLLLSLPLLLHAVHLPTGEECTQESLEEMQAQFKTCASGLGYQFEDTRNTFLGQQYVQESVCILFSKTVKECGKVWKKCHTEDEVQHLQDMHLKSLLSQYKDIQLDHCLIVKEYMQSGRMKEISQQVVICDDKVAEKTQEKFQACSHSSSTLAYEKIMDGAEDNLIKDILCDTLKSIETVCSKDLEKCFSDEDVVMMTTSHLKEMKKFLIRIVRGKVKNEALEDCDVDKQNIVIKVEESQLEIQNPKQDAEESNAEYIKPNRDLINDETVMGNNSNPSINNISDKSLDIEEEKSHTSIEIQNSKQNAEESAAEYNTLNSDLITDETLIGNMNNPSINNINDKSVDIEKEKSHTSIEYSIERRLDIDEKENSEIRNESSKTLIHESTAAYQSESINSSNKNNIFRVLYLIICIAYI
eukprot:GFUD01080077.1.p1 GENE.GFUD01080077.1~~GFUD01080077.1.p1  ORF type:complete len:423 (-),score=136.05 GFUD01080077.1:60-1328(-)